MATSGSINLLHGSTPARRMYAGVQNTNGSGDVTFAFTPAFPGIPAVVVGLQAADSAVYFHRITAISPDSVTVHVDRSVSVTVLGIGVLAVQTAANGLPVRIMANMPGQGV